MLTNKIEAIGRAPLAALDALARAVWQDFGTGKLTEAEAGALTEAIEARRQALRRPIQAHSPLRVSGSVREGTEPAPATNVASLTASPPGAARYRGRGSRQFVLRIPRPVTYDRTRSRERRRRLAYAGPLPPRLAARFTVGEAAALKIVADEVRAHGKCDRTLGEIAARAGVGRTTVQNAIRQAVKLGLVAVQERRRAGARSLSNVIRIVSAEWRSWLVRGHKGGGFKVVNVTDKACFQKREREDLSGASPRIGSRVRTRSERVARAISAS